MLNRGTNLEQRTVRELIAMVMQRRSAPGVEERAGGLARLAEAEADEIAAYLAGYELDPLVGEPSATHAKPTAPRERPAALRHARAIAAAFELGRRVETERAKPSTRLSSAEEVAAWAMPRIGALAHEELWLLALDGRGRLRGARLIAKGGLHGAAVHASDPLRVAIRLNASAFVLVHNHPSGDPTPSKEDIALTNRLAIGASLVGVVLLDHVVVSANSGFASVPFTPASEQGGRVM